MSSAPDDLNLRARQSARLRTLNAHLVAERDDVVVKQNRETNDADRVRHKKVYAPPIVSIALVQGWICTHNILSSQPRPGRSVWARTAASPLRAARSWHPGASVGKVGTSAPSLADCSLKAAGRGCARAGPDQFGLSLMPRRSVVTPQ